MSPEQAEILAAAADRPERDDESGVFPAVGLGAAITELVENPCGDPARGGHPAGFDLAGNPVNPAETFLFSRETA